LPLSWRRKLLESLFAAPDDPPSRITVAGTVGEVFEAVRKLRLEGLIGKRIDSTYEPGERSGAWIRLRTNMEQEFVIGGYIANRRENAAGLLRSWSARPLSSKWTDARQLRRHDKKPAEIVRELG